MSRVTDEVSDKWSFSGFYFVSSIPNTPVLWGTSLLKKEKEFWQKYYFLRQINGRIDTKCYCRANWKDWYVRIVVLLLYSRWYNGKTWWLHTSRVYIELSVHWDTCGLFHWEAQTFCFNDMWNASLLPCTQLALEVARQWGQLSRCSEVSSQLKRERT